MLFLGFFESGTDARVRLRPQNVISHTRFQAWPLESILVFRPRFCKIVSLLLNNKKDFLKSFRIRMIISLSFLLI